MKKVLSAIFIVFYFAFTFCAITERTASFLFSLTQRAESQTTAMRASSAESPRLANGRIHEDPYEIFRISTVFALIASNDGIPSLIERLYITDPVHYITSRGPPQTV